MSQGKLEVVFADEALVVVNKPAGVSVVFDRHRPSEPTLWQQACEAFGKVLVVHRLDRETSGALLLARSRKVQAALSRQFTQHQVRKVYHAFVASPPPWDQTLVDQPLRENAGKPHGTVVDWERGKPSRTHFRKLASLPNGWTLVEALPETGRRHQIRAHLACLGLPIVGDRLYGGGVESSRPLLHCWQLAFRHPISGQWVCLQAPYPKDMEGLCRGLDFGPGSSPPWGRGFGPGSAAL